MDLLVLVMQLVMRQRLPQLLPVRLMVQRQLLQAPVVMHQAVLAHQALARPWVD
jgi:hypothetical protein